MAPDPQPPDVVTRVVHADPWRAFVAIGGSALMAVMFLYWVIGDQFNAACNGTGDASSGPHSGTDCAQENYGFILLGLLGAVLLALWGFSLQRGTVSITATGVRRRYLFTQKDIPWEHVRGIETEFVSTSSGGLEGVTEQSLGLDKKWRVVARTDADDRYRRIVLLELRDETAARAWADNLSDWIGTTHHPRPPRLEPGE